MALLIQSGRTKLQFGQSIVLGRQDFPGDMLLSRRHIKIIERKGAVFIKDLDSRNGTSVNGQKITTATEVQIFPQDKVRIGNTEFICLRVETVRTRWAPTLRLLYLFLGVFSALVAMTFLDPTLAYGRSIGFANFFFVMGCLGLATLLSFLIWFWLLLSTVLSWPKTVIFVILALFTSAGLNAFLFYRANSVFAMGVRMITAKIHYFCVEEFNQARCVEQVAFCPSCAAEISKADRSVAVERLKAFRQSYPAEAVAKLKELEEKRQPAESSDHD